MPKSTPVTATPTICSMCQIGNKVLIPLSIIDKVVCIKCYNELHIN